MRAPTRRSAMLGYVDLRVRAPPRHRCAARRLLWVAHCEGAPSERSALDAHASHGVMNQAINGHCVESQQLAFLQLFLQRDATPAQDLARKSMRDVDGCPNVPLAAM